MLWARRRTSQALAGGPTFGPARGGSGGGEREGGVVGGEKMTGSVYDDISYYYY